MMNKSLNKIFKLFLLRVLSLNIYPFNKKFYRSKLRLLNSFHSKHSELTSHIALKKAQLKLPNEVIRLNQNIICIDETVAYIANGNFEELGLTLDEGADFLLTGFESFDEKIGIHPIFINNWFINFSSVLTEQIIADFSTNISIAPYSTNCLLATNFLYSSKTVSQVFNPLTADWQEEYFEALFKKEIWKARWINVRYTYAFLAAMLQKSPIGDLIEFISKFFK